MNTTYNSVYTFFKLLNLDVNEISNIYKTVEKVMQHRNQNAVNLVVEYTAKTCQSLILANDSRAFDMKESPKQMSTLIDHPIYTGKVADFEEEFLQKFNQLSMPARFVLWMQSFSTLTTEEIAHTLKIKDYDVCALQQEILQTFDPTIFDYFKQYAGTKPMPEGILQKVTTHTHTNRPKNLKNYAMLIVTIIIILCGAYYYYSNIQKAKEPEISINMEEVYYANINVKDYGTIEVCLDQSQAPITVDNFIHLANEGFYDNLTFHRIIDGFMIQGGDPQGNGMGGSDTQIVGEFDNNGHDNNISHVRGTISMARSQDPNSASSQFFIVHEDSPHLNGEYAAFGTVTKGMEIVDQIVKDTKVEDGNGTVLPENQPVIESVEIFTE